MYSKNSNMKKIFVIALFIFIGCEKEEYCCEYVMCNNQATVEGPMSIPLEQHQIMSCSYNEGYDCNYEDPGIYYEDYNGR